MTADSKQSALCQKYRKLLGVSDQANLKELKGRYAALHERFNKQLQSDDEAQVEKGQSNLILLDQAYSLLAKDIRTRESASQQQAAEEAMSGEQRLSIELATMRVGFQILDAENFFALETRKVDVNILGMRSVKTNNRVSTNWPSGKLRIFNDHFELKCIFGSVDLPYSDIVSITKVWYLPFYLTMTRKSDEDIRINVFGFGLRSKLKELAPQFTHKLRLDY